MTLARHGLSFAAQQAVQPERLRIITEQYIAIVSLPDTRFKPVGLGQAFC